MININIKGLLVDADFLMNYKSYNLSGEEAMFLLQISYLTNQGDLPFSIDLFTDQSNKSENEIVISTESKLNFIIFNKKEDYYTLRELLKLTERVTGRILTSKEIDIVTSWFEKNYTKQQIDEALTLSKNISYVNGILNNKVNKDIQSESGSSLGYDWFNK